MVKKILLVEDDKKISELVKDSLQEEGYFVDQSFDGEDGYFKIIESQPDLIILDIMIPKMNGYKVCSKVREIGITSPILMLTAKSGEYDVEIKLTKQEFDLLGFLLINSGNIVSKNQLLEEIWEILYPTEEDENKVEVYIGYLRKKLKPFNLDGHIHTVRGFGYRWNN